LYAAQSRDLRGRRSADARRRRRSSIQSDLLNIPVVRSKVLETTALGAAYAAGLAVGYWQGTRDLVRNWGMARRWEPAMEEALCVHHLDGVTGRQPTVVMEVVVPQSDGVGNHGVRLGLLQASSRDDHGALCRYRRVIGKREPVRCRRDRTDLGQRARNPDRVVPRPGVCGEADRAGGRTTGIMAQTG
jgi:hypothetical protein